MLLIVCHRITPSNCRRAASEKCNRVASDNERSVTYDGLAVGLLLIV